MPKMGLVAPQSTFLPQLSRNFRDAIKLGLGQATDNIDICIQPGGYLSRERDISCAIQKLIIEDDVELIILPLNPASLVDLNHLIENEGVPVIVCTMGENLIPIIAENEFTHVNSFQLWQCGWMLGYEAVRRFGSRVTLACSFKEGGYGISSAVDAGAFSAGGTLVNNLVSRQRVHDNKPFIDIDKLLEVETDVIVCNYSGHEAIEFFHEVRNCSELDSISLMSLPLGVEQAVLRDAGDEIAGVISISTWDKTADSSQTYIATCAAMKQSPTPYSLLAYESGMLIAASLALSEPGNLSLNDALKVCRLKGPRGDFGFCSSNPEAASNLTFKLSCTQQSINQGYHNHCLEQIQLPESCYQQMQRQSQPGEYQYTGWTNPYLIA